MLLPSISSIQKLSSAMDRQRILGRWASPVSRGKLRQLPEMVSYSARRKPSWLSRPASHMLSPRVVQESHFSSSAGKAISRGT